MYMKADQQSLCFPFLTFSYDKGIIFHLQEQTCGTPEETGILSEFEPFSSTDWVLLSRKSDWEHFFNDLL